MLENLISRPKLETMREQRDYIQNLFDLKETDFEEYKVHCFLPHTYRLSEDHGGRVLR